MIDGEIEDKAPSLEPESAPEIAPEPPAPEPDETEAFARQLGWRPREEWQGEEDRWVDAETFAQRATPRYAKTLEKRLEEEREARKAELARIERLALQAVDKQKRQHAEEMRQLELQQRRAVEDADIETYDQISKRREQLAQEYAPPQPERVAQSDVDAWRRENAWFDRDHRAAGVARAEAERVMREGGDIPAQLAAAKRAVEETFPQYAPKPRAVARPVSPESASAASRLVGAKKSAAEKLTAEERRIGERFVGEGLFKDLNEYAKELYQ